jgi:hypothetical protein
MWVSRTHTVRTAVDAVSLTRALLRVVDHIRGGTQYAAILCMGQFLCVCVCVCVCV